MKLPRTLLPALVACGFAQAALSQTTTDLPTANPARPTVSTPATLPPVGYLQFESGVLGAWSSPELDSQFGVNEVVKLAVAKRLEFLAACFPYADSRIATAKSNDAGDVDAGAQVVVHAGEGARPTVALSYFHRIYAGSAPDLDIGSFRDSALLLLSADVRGFHYDTNYIFNEQLNGATRRAQFGQTLSVSHALRGKFSLSGEIWHFSQPFLRANAIGNLWALNYNARNNLVFDGGFNRGLTSTSTHWELFAGFTYLLPRKLGLH